MTALRVRMRARDIGEENRASTPLELLFDLTFVVSIASLVTQLVHAIEEGHAGQAVTPFLMVFFAIWWAWNQFTWLASAYDTDDTLYRIFTMVQMGGVLVLAAGVPSAFADGKFTAITIGYLVMRLGLLGTLVRAIKDDPETRATAARYATGIAVLQAGWLLRLLLPDEVAALSFVILAIGELSVSPWADRASQLSWHPHHVAERYGLFTIILLGESVLAVTVAVQEALESALSAELLTTAIAGLVLLFTLWWLYFSEPSAEGLVARRERSHLWSYGHYFLFAALAAVGAGLEVAVRGINGDVESSAIIVGYSLAVPVSVVILMLWLVHAPMVERVSIPRSGSVAAIVVILLLPWAAPALGTVGVTAGITVVTVALLALTLFAERRRGTSNAE